MWRFIHGVTEPARKRQSDEEKRNYQHDYEKNKRARRFNADWVKGRAWLGDTDHGIVCTYCKEYSRDQTLTFVKGCPSYKIDSIIKHEKSKAHAESSLIYKAKAKPKLDSEAGKIIRRLNTDIITKLELLFRTCHGLVLHNRPLSDFQWVCDLDAAKGLNIGTTYRNRDSAAMFIKAIAEVELLKVSQFIQQSNFLCVVGDGTTDSSVKEQEMWFMRSSVRGEISVKYVGVHSTEKANAKNIVDGLKYIVESNLKLEWPDFSSKIIALLCDGASVMLGAVGGVGAILKEERPEIIVVHCMAHRLELALKDASKKVKLFDKSINVLCMGLYYFYHRSPLNRAMLVRSFNALKNDDTSCTLLMPTRIGGTRWIGHTVRALTNITTSYQYIVQHLGQLTEPTERVSVDSKAKAIAFLKALKNKNVLCFLFFLLDVLAPLKRLSLLLQERTCVISKQHTELALSLDIIRKYKQEYGPHLRKVIDFAVFEGVNLTNSGAEEFQAARLNLLEKIGAALEKRFADFQSPTQSVVILSTKIAHITAWPKSWNTLKGDHDLQVLLDHFQPVLSAAGVDVAEAELEWALLKREVHDGYFQSIGANSQPIPDWPAINQQFATGGKLSNVLRLIDLILSISPSSAEAERGFSQLKLIKTNLRSRLSQTTLNYCLSIKMLSPSIASFDPLPAINHWNECGLCPRRPIFKDKIASQKNVVTHTFQLENSVNSDSESLGGSLDNFANDGRVEDIIDCFNVDAEDLNKNNDMQEINIQENEFETSLESDSDLDNNSDVNSVLDEDEVFSLLLNQDE